MAEAPKLRFKLVLFDSNDDRIAAWEVEIDPFSSLQEPHAVRRAVVQYAANCEARDAALRRLWSMHVDETEQPIWEAEGVRRVPYECNSVPEFEHDLQGWWWMSADGFRLRTDVRDVERIMAVDDVIAELRRMYNIDGEGAAPPSNGGAES